MENINKLVDVLNQQIKIYEDLLNVSKNKTNVIVEGKVNELDNITKIEQTFVLKLGALEDELEKITDIIVKDFDIKEKEIKMSTILKYVKTDIKEKLEKQRDKIYELIGELDGANKLNAKLISNSLEYIEFSVNLFSNVNSESNGSYGVDGSINRGKSSFFDKKL